MNKIIFLQKKDYLEYLLLIFISFSFVFKITLSTLPILILIILSIKEGFKKKSKYFILSYLVFLLIFLLYFFSFLLLKDDSTKNIIRSLGLIFIPLLFFYKKINRSFLIVTFTSFLVFQISHIIYVDLIMIKIYFIDKTTDFFEISKKVEDYFIIERPYFSLNCMLVFYCLKYLHYIKIISTKILILICSFILISLFLVAARLSMGVCALLLIIFIVKNRIKIKSILILLTLLVFSFLLLGKHSFDRILIKKGEPRIVIWNCAKNIINSNNFNYILGEFSNDEADKKLIECYNTKNVKNGPYYWISKYNYNYNSHNQFIGFYLGYGMIGLILFLIIFLIHFFNYFKNNNIYSLLWVIIFFSQCMFENILYRQLGIYLFVWFSSISFFINYQTQQNE